MYQRLEMMQRSVYDIIFEYKWEIFLAALQPYKSTCPRWKWWKRWKCKNIFQFFSLVIKTKLVQNVNMMSERQNDMPKDSQTDRQTDRQTERQILEKQNKGSIPLAFLVQILP